MKFAGFLLLIAALLVPGGTARAAGDDNFFFTATAGGSLPFLPNLSGELDAQGEKGPAPGLNLKISLGRTLSSRNWAVELLVTLSRYPSFNYENDYEDFTGKLLHFDYAVVGKRCLRPSETGLVPYLGIGFGYGRSELVSGGGKLNAFQALALFQVESQVKDNISILFECSYAVSLTEERFAAPYTENVNSDVILDSAGLPLNDRFSSLEARLGVNIWLKPLDKNRTAGPGGYGR